jgi:hypothetical protein
LARWAADRKMSAGNQFVRFGTDRSDLETGEDVNLRAQWTASFLKRFPDLKAKVEVYKIEDGRRASEPLTTIALESIDTQPVVHEGRIAALGAGQYALKLVVDGADIGAEEIVSTVFVHAKLNAELSDLSANRTLLTRIAEASGGKLFLPDETEKLPEMFVSAEEQARLRQEVPLWDHWLLMLAFFALMTGEWVVRKLNGLP